MATLAGLGHAESEPVRLACDELSPEQSAEVDARTRATLLAEPDLHAEVRIRCEFGTATVLGFGDGQSASAVVALPSEHLKDDVLAAVDQVLSSLKRERATSTAAFPTQARSERAPLAAPQPLPPAVPALLPSPAPKPPPARDEARPGAARPVPAGSRGLPLRASAGALVERWSGDLALGARAAIETGRAPWAAGVALGGLAAPAVESSFTPTEWHALAFAAVSPERLGGVRVAAGAGLSLLLATPRAGLLARSATASPNAFGELELARPLRIGLVAIVPALGVRFFPTRRRVVLDGASRLALPFVTPWALLALGYDGAR